MSGEIKPIAVFDEHGAFELGDPDLLRLVSGSLAFGATPETTNANCNNEHCMNYGGCIWVGSHNIRCGTNPPGPIPLPNNIICVPTVPHPQVICQDVVCIDKLCN